MSQTILSDGIMEATLYPEGWIFLRWSSNQNGRLQKKLLQDLKTMERYIFENRLKGWFTSSEIDHNEFHSLLKRVGAKPWMRDAAFIYFHKWILKAEDLYHVRTKRAERTTTTPIS